ncbi:MAG: hypothetical protein ACE5Z5_04100 [Candidatus Bathyarchaeia archaeon]
MEEAFEPRHEYVSLFYVPSQVEVPDDQVRISVCVKKPSGSRMMEPHYGTVLKGKGLPEIYPVRVLRSEDGIAFGFHIESKGVYEVLERSALEGLRVGELYVLARKYDIHGRSKMVKEELVNALAPILGSVPFGELRRIIEGLRMPPPPPQPPEEARPEEEEPDLRAFAEWARRAGI